MLPQCTYITMYHHITIQSAEAMERGHPYIRQKSVILLATLVGIETCRHPNGSTTFKCDTNESLPCYEVK